MRRFLSGLAGLLFCAGFLCIAVGNAQLPMIQGAYTPSPSGSTPFTTNCSQSNTFLNTRIGGQGHGMSTTIAGYYDTMICGMVTDGTWAALDALYIFAAPTQTIANMNLVSSSYTITPHGGITFTANSNYQSDGSTGYLDTGFNPNTAGGHFSQNAASLGSYVLAANANNNLVDLGGGDSGSGRDYLENYSTGGLSPQGDINGAVWQVTGASTQGLAILQINSSSNVSMDMFQTGGPFSSNSNTASPAAPMNANFFIGAYGNNGTASNFTPDTIAAIFFGANINATQMSNRINAFMTSQGINVY